ncbi:SIR2 family protein [Litoribacter alkaliphilus]|uniref:SIR2 family protein n=1 Tax=Litoribacter ruber TaxID=702568 RepID=A0AAP2CK65_9BACT|nr:SIR2 family protein [Litoribacter alkaliphilus]MBS9525249.1 SIR2 family protein [Litoribacter alkaliphilus]
MLTNDNQRGRIVILFGAGATLSWNSPKTYELTTLVRKSGFKTTDNQTTITEYLFQALLKSGYSENDINFETIINLIEELTVYYSWFDSEKKLPSLIGCLLTPRFEKEIFNFSIKGGEIKHGYQLQIPAGKDYEFSDFAYHNETPQQFFLLHLLSEILTDISARISKYAYHTSGHSVVDVSSPISNQFCKWIASLSKRSVLRIYTLNYDRIFKILLERNGVSLFEGFDCGENIPVGESLRANVPKILKDNDCNCHYNLHGSAYWEVLNLDKNHLPNPEIVLTSGPNLPINNNPASFQVEKGKTLLVTNIITGYQKVQKTNITPYRQMYSAFDDDCCFADEIFIIGYSFGDEHINQSLKTAIRYNPKLKITIVDPSFIKNKMDFQFAIKFFPYRQAGNLNPKKVAENLYSYFDGAFVVHTKTFEEFLDTASNGHIANRVDGREP